MEYKEDRESVQLTNEGQKIFGIFHRPITNEKFPAVLICHGLAGHKTGRFRLYVDLAERLTKEGIGVLRIDFRGSGDSDGKFSEAKIEGMVSDALAALDYLNKRDDVDKTRIGIYGKSFGGAIAILAGKVFSNVKSIALWAPFFNANQWKDLWLKFKDSNMPQEIKDNLLSFNGQSIGLSFLEQIFLINLVESLEYLHKVPMLHIHGAKDPVIDVSHATDFKSHREKATATNEFLILPEADHDFSRIKDRLYAMDVTTKWFKNTL